MVSQQIMGLALVACTCLACRTTSTGEPVSGGATTASATGHASAATGRIGVVGQGNANDDFSPRVQPMMEATAATGGAKGPRPSASPTDDTAGFNGSATAPAVAMPTSGGMVAPDPDSEFRQPEAPQAGGITTSGMPGAPVQPSSGGDVNAEDEQNALDGAVAGAPMMSSRGTPAYAQALVATCAAECQKDIDCNAADASYADVDECTTTACSFLEDIPESPAALACVMALDAYYQCLVDASCDDYNTYWAGDAVADYPCFAQEMAAQTACQDFGEGPLD
ncbi:MAG: hypothetical protein VX589_08675 [Myxococcota bacterium]|nr:hypothetical protein [Myxococcota bacterium]